MPQLIGVKPLSQFCVDCVINNMAVLSKKPTATNNLASIDQDADLNLFDPLPSKFLEEIINALLTKQCLSQFLGFLATPQLQNLDLRCLGEKDDCSDHFKPESMRCVYLKQLFLSTSDADATFFTAIIPMFVKLQVLDISLTEADDSCLELLGIYCTDLRELKCLDCVNITDVGVKGLCLSAARNMGREDDNKLGLHRSLLKLGSRGTKITLEGIQMALENLPNLKVWDMATVQTLAKIHNEDFSDVFLIPKYSLIKLEVCPVDYIPKTLRLVVSMCPSVTQVEINAYERLTDRDLKSLLSLENLCNLKVSGDLRRGGRITFAGGVTPILKAFGNSSLQSLCLFNLSKVNIRVIAELCPKLRFLNLCRNLSYSTANLKEKRTNMEPPILKQLEELILIAQDSESTIPRENLILLLSAPSLVKLTIDRCCSLDDDVLQEVARIQKFRNLEDLEVSVCHNVTKEGMDVFLNTENPLKKIGIYLCRQLSKSDIECWEDHASMNNWQISFSYDGIPHVYKDFFEDGEDDGEDDEEDDGEDDEEDDEDDDEDDGDFFCYGNEYNFFIQNSEFLKELNAIGTHGCDDCFL